MGQQFRMCSAMFILRMIRGAIVTLQRLKQAAPRGFKQQRWGRLHHLPACGSSTDPPAEGGKVTPDTRLYVLTCVYCKQRQELNDMMSTWGNSGVFCIYFVLNL